MVIRHRATKHAIQEAKTLKENIAMFHRLCDRRAADRRDDRGRWAAPRRRRLILTAAGSGRIDRVGAGAKMSNADDTNLQAEAGVAPIEDRMTSPVTSDIRLTGAAGIAAANIGDILGAAPALEGFLSMFRCAVSVADELAQLLGKLSERRAREVVIQNSIREVGAVQTAQTAPESRSRSSSKYLDVRHARDTCSCWRPPSWRAGPPRRRPR